MSEESNRKKCPKIERKLRANLHSRSLVAQLLENRRPLPPDRLHRSSDRQWGDIPPDLGCLTNQASLPAANRCGTFSHANQKSQEGDTEVTPEKGRAWWPDAVGGQRIGEVAQELFFGVYFGVCE